MRKNIYTTIFAAAFILQTCLVFAQVKILYIARNDPPDSNDPAMIMGLEDLGYDVTAIPASAYGITSHIDHSADLIFFGEYISSGAVTPFKDAGFPTPCVSLEGYCPRGNRWAMLASDDDFGQIREDAQFGLTPDVTKHYKIKITNDHPIISASGLSVGEVVTWSTETTALPEVVWFDLPQAKAKALAQINGETNLNTFWVVEPDATDSGNPLNHRLVIWGVHDNGLGAATAEYWMLIDNSIKWALNQLSNTNETFIEGGSLKASPNPFSGATDITFHMKESGNVQLKVYDSIGRELFRNNSFLNEGEAKITFTKTGNMTGGIYYYSLFAEGEWAGTGKMILQ